MDHTKIREFKDYRTGTGPFFFEVHGYGPDYFSDRSVGWSVYPFTGKDRPPEEFDYDLETNHWYLDYVFSEKRVHELLLENDIILIENGNSWKRVTQTELAEQLLEP